MTKGAGKEARHDMGRIVVGIDGSETALRALTWAIDEAQLRHATLHVIHVYSLVGLIDPLGHTGMATGDLTMGGHVPEAAADAADMRGYEEQATRDAEQLIDRSLQEAGADVEGLSVEREAVQAESAAGALVERSRNADLLVVGSRGRGAIAGLLLGSVSRRCVEQAASPVVVIPSRD